MVKCSFCSEPAAYLSRVSGKAYCKKHFLRYFDRKVRRTIRNFKMFTAKEHIIVAVSGGKDSLSLLYYLVNLSKRVPKWRISALLIDEGIRGYRDVTIRDFLRIVNSLNVNYVIARFKDEFGYTLDEIVKIVKDRGLNYLPCNLCGVFRRYLLDLYARKMKGTVLATAHNLDDIIQTFIMNVMQNSWDRIVRLSPKLVDLGGAGFVKRVKPFCEMLEKETTLYSILNGLYPKFVECPYARFSLRWDVRKQLNLLEDKHPGIKYSLLRSLLQSIEILNSTTNFKYKLPTRKCEICGMPSSSNICKACKYRLELGLKM